MRHGFPASPYFLPLRPKYLPQLYIPTLSQSMCFLHSDGNMTGIDGLEVGCFRFDQMMRNDMGNRDDRGEESTEEKKGGKKERKKDKRKASNCSR